MQHHYNCSGAPWILQDDAYDPGSPDILPRPRSTMVGTQSTSRDQESRMQRKASAIWKGGLKDGKGVVSASSGVLSNTPYSFATRFENGIGTNPEELIAAAHAGCFSMALSGQMGAANLTVGEIKTTATVSMEKLEAGWTLTAVHLDVALNSPGADKAALETAAHKT